MISFSLLDCAFTAHPQLLLTCKNKRIVQGNTSNSQLPVDVGQQGREEKEGRIRESDGREERI